MAEEFNEPSVFDGLGEAPPQEPVVAAPEQQESSVFDSIGQSAPSGQIRMAVEAADSMQTPQAQRIMKLSSELGVSPYIVRDAPDQSEKISRLSEYDFDTFQAEAPKLTEWLQNDPIKLKALWEDLSVYKEIENDIKDFGFFGSLGQIWEATKHGAYKMLETAAQLPVAMSAPGIGGSSTATLGLTNEQLQDVGLGPVPKEDLIAAMAMNPLAKPFAERAAELEKNIPDFENAMPKFDAAVEQGDYARAARILLVNAAENIPQLTGMIAASVASRGQSLMLGSIAATTMGGTFQESLKTEGVSPEQAYGNALAATVFEFLGEKFSFGVGEKIRNRVANRFGKETFGRLLGHMGVDIMTGVGAEIMEENATSAGQLAANKIFGIDKTPWTLEQFKDTAKWTTLISGVSGGFMGGGTSLGTRGSMYVAAQKDMKFYEGLMNRLKQAKSKDTVPGSTEQVVEATTKGSPVENVWVDAAAFKTLFQKGDSKTAEQEMTEMGIPAKDFAEAAEDGRNVKVPLAKWAGKFAGTPVSMKMSADISFDPGRGTYNQEQKLQDAMTNLVKSAPGIIDDPRLLEEGVLANPERLTEIIQTKRRADELLNFYEELKVTDPAQAAAATQAIDQILTLKESLPDPEGDHKKLREGISNLISKEATGLAQNSREANVDIWEEWILRRAVTMGKKPLDILQSLNVSIQQARSQADLDPVTGESVLYQKNLPATTNQPTVSPLGLYSKVEEEVLKMDFKSMPAKDLKNRIANIQGLKKEEIDWMGLNEWLDARAQGFEGIKEGGVIDFTTTGEVEKVSKEEVLGFIRNNGVKIEQVVLSEDFTREDDSDEDNDKLHISELEWEEPKWKSVGELFGYGDDRLWNDVTENIEYGQAWEDSDIDDAYNEWIAELTEKEDTAKRDAVIELVKIIRDKKSTYEQKKDAFDKILEFKFLEYGNPGYQIVEKRVEDTEKSIESGDDDTYSAQKISLSNYDLDVTMETNGSYQEEWKAELPNGESFDTDTKELEEAKIRVAQRLLELGYIRGSESELINPSQVLFMDAKGELPLQKTIDKKTKELLKTDLDRLKAAVPEDRIYGETAEEKESDRIYWAERLAEEEVEARYADPENNKNNITIDIKHPFLTGQIKGNNKKGWTLDVTPEVGDGANKRIVEDLGKIPMAEVQAKALSVLQEKGLFPKTQEQQAKEDPEFDVNAPAGRAQYSDHVVPGGTNYREFKMSVSGFSTETRGHYDSSTLMHIRTTDRTDAEGKKILFIEEVQADPQKDREAKLPFRQMEAWAGLAMKRMLGVAVAQGYDSIAISPAAVHIERWGTQIVSWKKVEGWFSVQTKEGWKTDEDEAPQLFETKEKAREHINIQDDEGLEIVPFSGFVVSSNEQLGGNVNGMNLEETARERGILIEGATPVKTIEELKEVVGRIMSRDGDERSVESVTNDVWKQMETKPQGVKKPREEFLNYLYDKLIPNKVLPAILKKLDKDAKVEVDTLLKGNNPDDVWRVDLTDKLRESVKKGMTLFQKPGDTPLGQTAFGNDQVIITLFAGKNPSTLPHESMHYFVSEMAKDIAELQAKNPDELTPDQVRYMQDAGAMLEFAGATSFESLTEEGQEKIARAFEKYLMQGKAPSKKLRRAFKRFSVWLTSLYMRAKNELNVDLTPEMTRVFDNMLSVESAAQAARGRHDTLFDDPKIYGFNNQEATRYRRAIDDSVLAQEEHVRKILLKEQERELKRERRDLKKNVAKEVEQRREYQLIGRLKEQGVKIDGNLIIDMIGEDGYAKLPKGIAAKTSEGQLIDPEAAAEAMDYANAAQMLEELQNTPPIEEAIEAETERQFNEIFGDMIQQGRIEQEAIDAYNNNSMAEKIRMEMEMLMSENFRAFAGMAKKISKRLPSQEEVRIQAQRVVSRLKVSELKEAQFRRAMDHARAEAMSLFLEGKYEEAWEAKRKELLNHEILREVLKAKKEVDSALKRFHVLRKTDEDLSKSRNIDLVNGARMVLLHFGLWDKEAKHGKNPESYLKKLEEIDPDQLMGLNAIIDNALADHPNEVDYTTLSFQEFQKMRNAVMALWSVSKSSMEMEIEGKKLNRKEVVADLNKDIAHAEKMRVKALKKYFDKYGPETESEILGSVAWLTKIEHWAEAMGPSFKKYITRPVFHAIDEYRARKAKEMKRLMAILKPLKGKLHRKVIMADELGGTKKSFRGKNELMGALLHIGNKSNLMKLLVGYGWGQINEDTGEVDTTRWDAFLKRMFDEGQITKEDMDVVQAIWDLNEELKPEAQKAHKDQYGFFFDEITSHPVVTPFGTYRGGYMPATRDPVLAQKVETHRQAENLLVEQHVGTFPTTGRGFTMSRVAGAEPLLLSLNATAAHLDQVLRFVYINPAVRAAGRLFNDKDFMANMNAFDPTVVRQLLIPWAKRAAHQRKSESANSVWQRRRFAWARHLRQFAGLNALAFNVTNAFQNATGKSLAATKVHPKFLAKANALYWRNPKAASEEIQRRSKFMDQRITTQLFDITKGVNDLIVDPNALENGREWVNKNGYWLARVTQDYFDRIAWMGAYHESISKGESEREAVAHADETVRMTQGSFEAESMSEAEFGSPITQIFNMFFGYFNNQANLNFYQHQKNMRELAPMKQKFARAAYLYAVAFMVPAILNGGIRVIMSGDDWDEDDDGDIYDDVLSLFFNEQVNQTLAMIPHVGGLIKYLRDLGDDKRFNDRLTGSPVFSFLESAGKGVYAVPNLVEDLWEGNTPKKGEIRDALALLGFLGKIPTVPFAKPINYQMDVESGKAEPTGPVDYLRGLVTGRPGGN